MSNINRDRRIFPDEQGVIVGNGYRITGGRPDSGPVNLYVNEAVQTQPVGALLERADGARFRYVKSGAAVNRGLIVAPDFSETGIVDTDNALVAAGSGFNAVDNVKVRISSTDVSSIAKDEWAGGYLHTTDDTGEGYVYRIMGNTATAANVTDVFLYDKIQVALDTTTDIEVTPLPWWKVVAAVAGTDALPLGGVTMATLTSAYYGWVQTRGVGTVLCDLAVSINSVLTLSDGVAGAAQVQDAYTEPIIGYSLHASDDQGHGAVFITIE
jgi:hypothetical protein